MSRTICDIWHIFFLTSAVVLCYIWETIKKEQAHDADGNQANPQRPGIVADKICRTPGHFLLNGQSVGTRANKAEGHIFKGVALYREIREV